MKYWLMKSEPQVYSLTDLQQEGKTIWDGVRNYQARNFLRTMNRGDLAFFYHSNTNNPGIVGLMRVVETEIADPSQFNPDSPYYDPKSLLSNPRWQTVKVEFLETFPEIITLKLLKQEFCEDELVLIKKGIRLSVMPISDTVAERIINLSKKFL